MGQVQDKVLGAISERAEAAGFEYVTKPHWSNNGMVYLMKGFVTKLSISYDFQSGYAELNVYPEIHNAESASLGKPLHKSLLFYADMQGALLKIFEFIDNAGDAGKAA